MAKIEITRTELVWPGKYNEDGTRKEVPRVSLPFQVIEPVNESRATRETKKGGTQATLFDVWEGKEGDTFYEGHSLAMLRRIAAALDKRVEIRFLPAKRHTTASVF